MVDLGRFKFKILNADTIIPAEPFTSEYIEEVF